MLLYYSNCPGGQAANGRYREADVTSWEAAHAQDKLVGAQRNSNMKKLLGLQARYPENEALYDVRCNPDPAVIKRMAHAV